MEKASTQTLELERRPDWADIDAQIRRDLIDQAYSETRHGYIATLLNSLILAGIFQFASAPMPQLVIGWLMLMVVFSFLRLPLYQRYGPNSEKSTQSREKIYILTSFIAGVLWASLGPLVVYADTEATWLLVATITQTGMVAGSVYAMSACPRGLFAFGGPVLLSIFACYFTLDSVQGAAYILCTGVFTLVLYLNQRNTHRSKTSYSKMSHEMTALMAQLVEAKEYAEEASRSKSSFLANMSHEIRTPLNGVMGTLQLLEGTELNTRQNRLVSTSQESADALHKLLGGILDLSKIEAGRFEMEEIEFSPHELAEQVAAVYRPLTIKKGLGFETSLNMPPDEYLIGDSLRVKQVLSNIIGNALKFTRHGHIKLELNGERLSSELTRIRFAVSDTGVGIAPESHEIIFNAFDQADPSTTRNFGGTGLGLNICQQIINLMRGKIGVESDVGRGATFWFEIDLQRAENNFADENLDQYVSDPIPAKVLLVEDNKVNQIIARGLLERMGARVELAVDGENALEMLSGEEFDIVLMDCQMPKMDGYEATRYWRSIEEDRGQAPVPIIALTANAMTGDREKCLAAGMSDYVSKPFRKESLRQTIGQWYRRNKRAA